LIDINQDSLGRCARVLAKNKEGFVLVKELDDGGRAVGLCNQLKTTQRMSIRWADTGLAAPSRVRDCWRGVDLKQLGDHAEIEVPPRFVEVLRLDGPARQ
jgi:alpha-galactosidase